MAMIYGAPRVCPPDKGGTYDVRGFVSQGCDYYNDIEYELQVFLLTIKRESKRR